MSMEAFKHLCASLLKRITTIASLKTKLPSSPISFTSSPQSNTQIALPELNTAAPPPHDLPSLGTTSSATTISMSCNLSPSYRNMASSSSSSLSSSNLQRSASTSMSTTQRLYFQEQKQTGSPITSQLPQMVTFDQCSEEACNRRMTECAICLCELQGEQEVRELPECRHIFHKHCIDGWIWHNHHTCPLCRSSLLTPVVVLHKMLHEQSELSFQTSTWSSSLPEEEEDAFIQDHFHQTFFFPLQQPAGHGITGS
ncbi:hypothetical protein L7F22_043131 [Adiantum nelumboides]|nr:hypothetical protein [Adiantum nelumboides]